ncbi:orotate phosphoribosyltransferase [Cyanobacterium aponinum UTEX 3222]|uniref:Orotate phosphoribosyltransferase n=2 Tax=Cyanobacterium aponinum TaxID=379064 RepID=K9Z1H8_CYAAP|nr:orotate phosphoribosyltransferase [Cyanobacterium aponinum]WRL42370.1 orotate phosphoribosyltransferase [Cyanobacterium aponinum UTEX 3222]AFZ52193.1 orotate phosphoribosyltransferase [Cyanobacterium aponinum PCC 10605]MBD2392856.1 orotate phosphoribosyltransferase [Cyanobacterium aponinum FACHB-4101]PHV63941.1 orotate phosphoribosyltransferase [Cyanobacterium aponinum IPPAS B-1201]WPF88728.1 orotate phosphoribosyltransferase [Cyanobacterium aponinum AL20115]
MENNNSAWRQQLLNLLVEYAYQEGDFTLSSGQKSSFYLNGKQVTLRAEGALLVGKLIFSMLSDDTDAIAGLTLGADPMVSAVSVVSAYENKPIPALIIRKEAKGHGTKAYIEGPTLKQGALVTVLEDVVTTGKSAMLAVERLTDAGYKVNQVISLVDRLSGGRELYQSHGLSFASIFTIDEIQAHSRK